MEKYAFMTLDQCAEYLNTCRRTARKLLEKFNIQPVDYGPGRRNGLRWSSKAIISMAEALHNEAQEIRSKNNDKKKVLRPIYGKSSDDLFNEIYGGK